MLSSTALTSPYHCSLSVNNGNVSVPSRDVTLDFYYPSGVAQSNGRQKNVTHGKLGVLQKPNDFSRTSTPRSQDLKAKRRNTLGRSTLAYAYKTSETTTSTIRHGQTADYVLRSRTTKLTNWSSVEPGMETRGSLRIEQHETTRNHDHRKIRDSYCIIPGPSGMETRGSLHIGSLHIEQPELKRNHDHRKIRDSYRIVPGPSGVETRGSLHIEQPETTRSHDHRKIRDSYRIVPGPPNHRSSDRKYRQGVYNHKPSGSQGQRLHSYSSGEEPDHKSSKHRCDKNSSQISFQSGHKSNRSQYSDDRSRKIEYEPDANIRSSRRDRDYGQSNKYDSGRTSNQNHYNRDSGQSLKYERDYKAGSRYHNEDNSRSNKYKTEPRYEEAGPKICSTIEEKGEELPNYYAMLGISPFASADETRRAAKSKRVEIHPGKCVKPDMSEIEKEKAYEIAAAVGQAAYVLTDAELRWWYDMHRWDRLPMC